MAELNYTITINAPKEKVWHVMLDPESYKAWTSVFQPGSYYEGSLDKGSEIKFVAEDDNGLSGLYGRIAENIQYEYLSIEYLGEIVNGQVDTTGDEARTWIGAHENYNFTEVDGKTTVDVSLIGEKVGDEMAMMFDGMWPKALHTLKELCEADSKKSV